MAGSNYFIYFGTNKFINFWNLYVLTDKIFYKIDINSKSIESNENIYNQASVLTWLAFPYFSLRKSINVRTFSKHDFIPYTFSSDGMYSNVPDNVLNKMYYGKTFHDKNLFAVLLNSYISIKDVVKINDNNIIKIDSDVCENINTICEENDKSCKECKQISYEKESFVREYSNPNNWPNKKIPSTNEDVIIKKEWNMKLDITTELLGTIYIYGNLFVDLFSDGLVLNAKRIVIIGGELNIGTEQNLFRNKFSIILVKSTNEKVPIYSDDGVDLTLGLNSYILNLGVINVYGDDRGVHPSQLSEFFILENFESNSRIATIERNLALRPGDTLLIRNSDLIMLNQEVLTVESYDKTTGKVTFNTSISSKRYGRRIINEIPELGVFDLRTKMHLVQRNVVIQAQFDNIASILNSTGKIKGVTYISRLNLNNCQISRLGKDEIPSLLLNGLKVDIPDNLYNIMIDKNKGIGIKVKNTKKLNMTYVYVDNPIQYGIMLENDLNNISLQNVTVTSVHSKSNYTLQDEPLNNLTNLNFNELNACFSICLDTLDCDNIQINNSQCDGSEMYGFLTNGPNCLKNSSKSNNISLTNNKAHSSYAGFLIYSYQSDCVEFSGNNIAYNNLGYGLSAYVEANQLIVRDFISINNQIGFSALLASNNENDALVFKNNIILGYDKLYPVECTFKNGIFNKKVGIILPTLLSPTGLNNLDILKIPHHKPVEQINNTGYSLIKNNTLKN